MTFFTKQLPDMLCPYCNKTTAINIGNIEDTELDTQVYKCIGCRKGFHIPEDESGYIVKTGKSIGFSKVDNKYIPHRPSDNEPMKDHELRVYYEWEALHYKIHDLKEFIYSNPIYKSLPEEDQNLLTSQLGHMEAYCAILKNRVYRF